MITDEMKRLATYLLEGDTEAAFKLFRLMKRLGFGTDKVGDNVFSFGDGDLFDYQPQRFRATEGKSYRFSFGWWPGSEDLFPDFSSKSPRFFSTLRHWSNSARCYILNKGPEYTELLGQPKLVAGTAIVSWPVDEQGRLIPQQISSYEVQPWIISQHVFRRVKSIHEEFPLNEFDLELRCTDQRFQRLDIRPARRNIFLQMQNSEGGKLLIFKDIARRVHMLISDMESFLGRNMDIDSVRDLVGQNDNGEGFDFDDLFR